MATKIGFNNFKAFGPKMQYFTKKPITLIYGPNSVGKSSLIRALLFKEYLKTKRYSILLYKSKVNFDPKESLLNSLKKEFTTLETPYDKRNYFNITTDYFGDSYNIGTFESLIHKRDVSQNVNYDIQYNLDNTLDILPYSRFFSGFLMGFLQNMKSRDIDLDLIKLFNDYMLSKYYEKDEDLENNIQACGFEALFIEIEKYLSEVCSIDTNSLSKKENIKILSKFMDFTKSQFDISSFQIKTSINKELLQEHKFYIDNELIFECKELDFNVSRTYNIILNTRSESFKKVFFNPSQYTLENNIEFHKFKINLPKYDIQSVFTTDTKIKSIFDISTYYEEYLKSTLYVIISRTLHENDEFRNVYIGPLRSIPSRSDFNGEKSFFKKQRRKQRLIDKNHYKCLNKMYGKFRKFESEKYLKLIINTAFWISIILCKSKQLIETMLNSIFRISGSFPKFIKPNSKNYLKLWYSITENKKVSKKVNQWLQDKGKHNSAYSIHNDNISFNFFDESTNTTVHPQDMGVGISQSLPIIIASTLYKYTNIYIEQPELHLHPKLQMELADEFIKNMHENKNNFILETHSEHILLRIMKRMRHTDENIIEDKSLKLTPADICLLYVDNNGETTYIKELELDKDGTLLDPWPNGFFEEGYKERFE